jgi:integrase
MIANAAKKSQSSSETLYLPTSARTRSGIEFDPRLDKWNWRESTLSVSFNFSLASNLSPELMFGFKRCTLWYVENNSPSHAKNCFERFLAFARWICESRRVVLSEITPSHVLGYRSTLTEDRQWYLATLSGFLKKWYEIALGVSFDTVSLLKQLRLVGNKKGKAVLTLDVKDGPYSDIEWQSIQEAVKTAFKGGAISTEEFLLVNLFMLLGARPIQIAALNLGDIYEISVVRGSTSYLLKVPRAKQRASETRFHMKDRLVVPEIGQLLVEHANELKKQLACSTHGSNEIPMFPLIRNSPSNSTSSPVRHTSGSISLKFQDAIRSLQVRSERTGEDIKVTATRFRRTIGTRAAAEGHGELIIAELLDHTDTQNVGVYVQSSPAIVERIDRAVAMRMAPLAQAFSGTLIRNESEASRKSDPSSRICDPRIEPSLKPMGNCGKFGYCGLLAPIACYTCANFQPWIDGPHLKVLDFLIQERDRLLETTDHRIASLNDRTILAVAEVARQCAAIQNPSEENPSV